MHVHTRARAHTHAHVHTRAYTPTQCTQQYTQISTHLEVLFFLGSSIAKMWTVPWSLDTHISEESWLKFILEQQETIVFKSLCYLNPYTHNLFFIILKTYKTHINFESKLCVLCTYYRLWAYRIPKNIGPFCTQNKSLRIMNFLLI